MKTQEILDILTEEMSPAFVASVDAEGQPHARPIFIGLAQEEGIFFMTHPTTNFHQQLMENPRIAILGFKQETYAIQVIRIEGEVRPVGPERLRDILTDNPYVDLVYPDIKSQESAQVFQMFQGEGFYHSLTQGHRYEFSIQASK